MRRWAWRIFVAISGAMLIGTFGMWTRAQWAQDIANVRRIGGPPVGPAVRLISAVTYRGSVVLSSEHYPLAMRPAFDATNWEGDPPARGDDDDRYASAAEIAESPRASARHGPAETYDPRPSADPAFVIRGGTLGGFGWRQFSYQSAGRMTLRASEGDRWFHVTRNDGTAIALPWWFLLLLFALAPARAIYIWRKARSRPPHACPTCGYDCRATLERCPECGTVQKVEK